MNLKKSLCLLLSLLLVLSSLAVSAYADTSEDGYLTYTIENGEVTITDCDTSISGEYAIPDTIEGYPVTAIGYMAFYLCTHLTGIVIPESIETIGGNAFAYCTSLEKITVSDDSEYFSNDSYVVLFNKDKTELIAYPYNGAAEYAIPDSVTSIGSYAFRDCTSLESVEIPANVTYIGTLAFYLCYSLEGIFVSEDNKYYSNDSYGVLFNKDKTELIQFPTGSGITEYSIPDGVTKIDHWVFYECSSLDKISIPESVISIGLDAFHYTGYYNNSSNWEDGVLYIDDCLIDARNLTADTYTVKDGTRLIAYAAFAFLTSVENIILPDSVTTINSFAFQNCESLTSITIPTNIITMGLGVFNSRNNDLIIHGACGSKAYSYAKEYSINFEATDHPDTEITNAVEATCTETGLTEGLHCSVCGEILIAQEVIPVTSHEYVETITEATCTEKGYITYTCAACGDSYTEEIQANGHTFTDWETVKEATYLEQGETSRYCTVCGYTETEAIDCIIPDASASDGDVEIDYTEGTFDGDVTVKADKVQDENKYLLITDHFRNNGKNARAEIYDISTYVHNQKVQPNGSVLVRIPIPQGYNREKICVVYITDNGEIQNVPCRCADGYVYFEASHFSMYAIVEATEDESDDDSSSVSSFVQFICKFVRLLCKLFGKEAYYDALEQSIVKILGAIF